MCLITVDLTLITERDSWVLTADDLSVAQFIQPVFWQLDHVVFDLAGARTTSVGRDKDAAEVLIYGCWVYSPTRDSRISMAGCSSSSARLSFLWISKLFKWVMLKLV